MTKLLSKALGRAEKLFGGIEAAVDGESRLSYREVARRCRGVAGGLRKLGAGKGDRVATLMQNGHRYLEAYFAVPGSGAVLVPLNNRLAIPEDRYILEDAAVKVLIADGAHAAVARELASSVAKVILAPEGYEALSKEGPEAALGEGIGEEDLAGLFYTGGTTGAAKGVMLTHRNLVANAFHVSPVRASKGYTPS